MKSLMNTILKDAIYRLSFWLAAALIVCAITPAFEQEIVFLELTTHFSQLFALCGVVLFFYVVLRRRKYASREVAVMCILAMLGNAAWLIPFLPFKGEAPPAKGDVLKVVQLNVLKVNRHTDEVVEWLRNEAPDVVSVQEVDLGWLSALAALRDIYTHRVSRPSDDLFGIAVFSRYPFKERRIEKMPIYDAPAIFAEIDWKGTPVRIAAVHSPPPLVTKSVIARKHTLDIMAKWSRTEDNKATLVLADLNVTPATAIYRRVLKDSGLSDPRQGRGLLPTWPAPFPALVRLPLDYILHNDKLRVVDFRIGPSVRSDHHPVIAVFEAAR